jgi:hypothetical protein
MFWWWLNYISRASACFTLKTNVVAERRKELLKNTVAEFTPAPRNRLFTSPA